VSLAVSLVCAGVAVAGESQKITILHTSDLHGAVLPFDDARDRPAPGSLARVSAAVASIRQELDHPVLLLDSGDTLQGSPLEEFFSVRRGEASPTVEAMNRIGYDAMAVGNHEFNFGLEPLRRAEKLASFPFLSANTLSAATGEPAFEPFVVREAGAVRVGILGLTTPNIPNWESPENYRGLEFADIVASARAWVERLRTELDVDLVVVLAHTGFESDLDTDESNDTAYENFGTRLIDVAGIDLLLTGHAHRDIAPREISGVVVSQPSSRGRRLTRIDLELERRGSGWAVRGWQGENLDTFESAIDDALVAAFAERREQVRAHLAEPLTTVDAPVSTQRCRVRDCAALDLIHAVQLEASGAEISLASLLTDATPELSAGPVHRRWVRSLYVYANTLQAVRVTGAQLKDILEHSARYYDGVSCSDSVGCAVLVDPQIRRYNVDTVQGADYRIDPTRPEGDRVVGLRRNGRPLDLHETFTLVCNNYRAAGGGGFPHLGQAEVVWRSSREVAELIAEYLGGLESWSPEADENWVIAPQFQHETRDRRNVAHPR
jgi:2',3'-cyclic-nucleotide 2'-phosphodiesterase/3'-nucleotidase